MKNSPRPLFLHQTLQLALCIAASNIVLASVKPRLVRQTARCEVWFIAPENTFPLLQSPMAASFTPLQHILPFRFFKVATLCTLLAFSQPASPGMPFQPSWRSSHICWALVFPSLCAPTHPKPSQLGWGRVIVEAVWRRTHTRRDHPYTYSASHKRTAVGTKHLKFVLIRPKDKFPPG